MVLASEWNTYLISLCRQTAEGDGVFAAAELALWPVWGLYRGFSLPAWGEHGWGRRATKCKKVSEERSPVEVILVKLK